MATCLCLTASPAPAQEVVKPPRRYDSRVILHQVPTPSHAPVTSDERQTDTDEGLAPAYRPIAPQRPLSIAPQPPPPHAAETEEENWIRPPVDPELRGYAPAEPAPPSGWGWLADEVTRRMSERAAEEAGEEGETSEDGDPLSGEETNAYQRAQTAQESGLLLRTEPSALDTGRGGEPSLRFSPIAPPTLLSRSDEGQSPSTSAQSSLGGPENPQDSGAFFSEAASAPEQIEAEAVPESTWDTGGQADAGMPRTEELLRQAKMSIPSFASSTQTADMNARYGLGGGAASVESPAPATSPGGWGETRPPPTGSAFGGVESSGLSTRQWEGSAFSQPSMFESRGFGSGASEPAFPSSSVGSRPATALPATSTSAAFEPAARTPTPAPGEFRRAGPLVPIDGDLGKTLNAGERSPRGRRRPRPGARPR